MTSGRAKNLRGARYTKEVRQQKGAKMGWHSRTLRSNRITLLPGERVDISIKADDELPVGTMILSWKIGWFAWWIGVRVGLIIESDQLFVIVNSPSTRKDAPYLPELYKKIRPGEEKPLLSAGRAWLKIRVVARSDSWYGVS